VSYSILHLSDLHRAGSDPISNDELISTLLADRDRYVAEEPPVPEPAAIVVSGDVINGVPLGSTDVSHLIRGQYELALDFLARLTDAFLGGDRGRVILVPGNHDVDWNTAYSAMEPVPNDQLPKSIEQLLFGPQSDLRWNWEELRAYRIVDRSRYEQRLDAYHAFVREFYDGVDLLVPPSPHSYYWLAELDGGRIGLAAFNSCSGNDCFARQGTIPQEAIAQAHMTLRERQRGYDLQMAVWHHNVEGVPAVSDYMDISSVYALTDKGFRLGLHGHQHRAQASYRVIKLPQEAGMAVISAGSLSVGDRGLPTGVNRQYNIIEIAGAYDGARVHVREMAVGTSFAPAMRAELGGRSWVDLSWGADERTGAARDEAREQALVLDAERALAEGRGTNAAELLRRVSRAPGSYARALMIRALAAEGSGDELISEIAEPHSVNELVTLVKALGDKGEIQRARDVLSSHSAAIGLTEATRKDLEAWLHAKEQLAR
jgi:Calcineurin-like phosphoesterase